MTLPCRDVESHTEKHGLKYPIIFISLSNRCFVRLPGERKTALKPALVYSFNAHCTGNCSQQAATADLPPWHAVIGKEALRVSPILEKKCPRTFSSPRFTRNAVATLP